MNPCVHLLSGLIRKSGLHSRYSTGTPWLNRNSHHSCQYKSSFVPVKVTEVKGFRTAVRGIIVASGSNCQTPRLGIEIYASTVCLLVECKLLH